MLFASSVGLLFSWLGALVVVLSVVHFLVCTFLIAVVLLQRGRSGDAVGGMLGPSTSSYAAMTTDDLFSKLTKIGAGTFMVTSLVLALFSSRTADSVVETEDDDDAPPVATAPVEPGLPGEAGATPEATEAAPAEPAGADPVPADGEAPAPDAPPEPSTPTEP